MNERVSFLTSHQHKIGHSVLQIVKSIIYNVTYVLKRNDQKSWQEQTY